MNIREYILIFIVIILSCFIIHIVNNDSDNDKRFDTIIETLMRGSARWAVASLQDKSPLIAVLHGNYAAGYLWGVRDVFTDEEIRKATNIKVVDFQKKIIDIQDKATKEMVRVCPKYSTDLDIEMAKIAGDVS